MLGRPIFFNENDSERDRRAQQILEDIVRKLGIKHVEFQYEPIAAALDYESKITEEEIALIVDIGGGTSDVSVLRLRPGRLNSDRNSDILANLGAYIGGNLFDRKINFRNVMPFLGKGTTYKSTIGQSLTVPPSLYLQFSTWHRINALYNESDKDFIRSLKTTSSHPHLIDRFVNALEYELGHIISNKVETAKIELSRNDKSTANFSILGDRFDVEFTYQQLVEDIQEEVSQICSLVKEAIKTANLANQKIDSVFFTGGSTRLNLLKNAITKLVPQAKIVEGNAFNSVARGLTIDAWEKFGSNKVFQKQ